MPTPKPPGTKGKRVVKTNAASYAALVFFLLDGTRTQRELAEETGLHYITVGQHLNALHKAGATHITLWEKDSRGRDSIPIYVIGKGKDAKRAKLTPTERQARHRAKKRQLALLHTFVGTPTS